MSLVTRSPKRNRVYARKFDHDACWSLWNSDRDYWTYRRLAERYGVTETAVKRVIDPHVRQKMDDRVKAWVRDNQREPCKGGCGRLVWLNKKHVTGYCNRCLGIQRTADSVRDDALRCCICEEWKPDDDFYLVRRRWSARRGRRSLCRACENEARNARRRAQHKAAQESLDV